MADRRDYFFRQKVTEAELDAGFEGIEQADFNLAVDNNIIGVVEGMGVSEKSGTPDLSVDVQGPGTAYSKDGERINFSSTQNVDVSEDDGGSPTTVGTPGNTKVVSVFIVFDRALSDPRTDGNGSTVYFQRDESFEFSVVQGSEAVIGSEVPPPLDSGKILLADIRLENGTTQVLDAATVGAYDQIDTTRREDAFKFTGGTVEIEEGTAYDAINSFLTEFNNHIDGTSNKHPADEVTYAGSGNWETGSPLAGSPADVEAAIDQIVADLATTSSPGGSEKVGSKALSAWHDTNNIAAGDIYAQIDAIVTQLSSTASQGGADKIGAAAISDSPDSLTGGSIYDQLVELLGHVNDRADTGEINTWTAANTFSALLTANLGINLDGAPLKFEEDDDETELLNAKMQISPPDPDTTSWERGLLFKTTQVATETDVKLWIESSASDDDVGFSITLNAAYGGTTWTLEQSGLPAYRFKFHEAGVTFQRKASGSGAWAETAWDDALDLNYGAGSTDPVQAELYNGKLTFESAVADATGSNITQATTPASNTLYAKNICKAWGHISLDSSGTIISIDGFNIQTPSDPGASSIISVSFRNTLSSALYAVVCSSTTGGNYNYVTESLLTSGFTIRVYDADTGSTIDHDSFGVGHALSFIVFGTDT
jgi:hypothetical protein